MGFLERRLYAWFIRWCGKRNIRELLNEGAPQGVIDGTRRKWERLEDDMRRGRI